MATEENNVPVESKEAHQDSAVTDSNKQEETVTTPTTEASPPAKQAPTPAPSVHKTNYEKDVVYLYQFSRTPLVPSLSPYCLKVETWLRLAGLKYEVSAFDRVDFLFICPSTPPLIKFLCRACLILNVFVTCPLVCFGRVNPFKSLPFFGCLCVKSRRPIPAPVRG